MQAEKLVRMANQIAANFDYGSDKDNAVAGVVDHLQRFWTPSMLEELVDYDDQGEITLSLVAKQAVAQLAQNRASAN